MTALHSIPAAAWVQHLGWTLIQFLWQGTLIAVLFAIARGLFRDRMTAHARYLLACGTLVVMVMAPGLTLAVRVSVPLRPAWPVPSPDEWQSVLPWLVAAWLTGVVVCFARLVAGWRLTTRLRFTGVRPPHAEWPRRLQDLARRVGVSRPVRLLVSSLVDVPVVVGWWRPIILMPVGALTGLPPAHVEALLAHELAHIRRLDYLINVLQSLAEAALFYHPAIWWVSDQIRAERELCCDDLAVAASGDILTYAHALAELESHRPAHKHALAATGGSLLDRIRRLLGQAPPISHVLPGPGAAGTMTLLCLLGIGVAGTHAASSSMPSPPPIQLQQTPAAELVAPSPHPVLSTLLFGPLGPAPVSVSSQSTPDPFQNAAKAGTGAISGVVTDAATHRPISGVIVHLSMQGQDAVGRVSQQITDARGRFVFDELLASTLYFITASKSGYLDGHFGEVPGQRTSHITLADGQWFSSANFEMSKVGAIGGVVTDEFGQPVVGAFVRALVEIKVGGQRQLAVGLTTRTDDHGEYRLAGLLPAHYILMVPSVQSSVPATATPAQVAGVPPDLYAQFAAQVAGQAAMGRSVPYQNYGAIDSGSTHLIVGNFVAPPPSADGQDRAYPITFFSGATTIGSATAIDLTDGEEKSGINISLQPVAAVHVSGRVEGMTTPVRLTLRLTPTGLEGSGAGSDAATTIVNGDGTFTFLSVPAGNYTIDARQSLFEFFARTADPPFGNDVPPTPGRDPFSGAIMGVFAGAPAAAGYSAKNTQPGSSYSGHASVTVGAANVSNVVITLQPTVTIRGRITYEDMPNGTPRRPNVRLEPASGNWGLGIAEAGFVRPDADQTTFTIDGVVPGLYNLRAYLPPTMGLKSIMVDGRDRVKTPIDATSGHDIDVVVTITGKVATLSGAVHDAQGRLADHAAMLAFTTDRSAWPDLGLAPVLAQLVPVSNDGTFSTSALPAGDYYVIAMDAARFDGWTDPAFLEKAAAAATRVSLEWGSSKTVSLTLATVK